MKLDGCSALITGASAGIGLELAHQLAPRARELVLVARRRERLEQLSAQLKQRFPALTIYVRPTDLCDHGELNQLVVALEKDRIEIDFLINNAGLGDMGSFGTSDPDRVNAMVLVNVRALTFLSRALLPAMLSRRRGAILNVSSSAGFLPLAGFAVYAATKAYVTSFSEALRAEVRGTGISVTALCPGPVHTEFLEVARRPQNRMPEKAAPEQVYVSAQMVARTGLRAVERDRALVIPGILMKIGMLLVRLTPLPILRMASVITAKR